MKTETQLVTGIDIGTTRVRTIITENDEKGLPVFLGHGSAPAEGMKRGVIVNMEKAIQSISRSVEDAELMAGVHIDSAVVSLSGDHIKSINSHGVMGIAHSENEIDDRDVNKAIETASAVAIPTDREIVHVLPQEYTIDEQTGIKNPLGMSGVRLEVEVHIVTAAVTSVKNIYRALKRCEIEVEHLVMQSLALSYACISSEEEEMGVVLLDIGGDLTDIAIFFDGSIRHTGVVSLGGKNVTNDITIGLRTTLDQAEKIKIGYGSALASLVDPDDMMEVAGAAGREPRSISRNVLATIIEPRMEEILSLTAREVKKSNPPDSLTAGVILSGGGAMLPGVIDLVEQIFDMPAKLGTPTGVDGFPDSLSTSEYATAIGLINYGLKHDTDRKFAKGKMAKMFKKIENWFTDNF